MDKCQCIPLKRFFFGREEIFLIEKERDMTNHDWQSIIIGTKEIDLSLFYIKEFYS